MNTKNLSFYHWRKKRKSKHKKAKENKDQVSETWIKKIQREYLQVTGCMYDFLAGFGMHGTCMCVFGFLVVIGMVLQGVIVVFNLAFPFPDSHGVMGFFHLVELDF